MKYFVSSIVQRGRDVKLGGSGMKKFGYGLLLLLFSHATLAFSPAQGLWWNPNESGRGYTIDVQNNVMIVTAYVYAPSGAATWFLASGTYEDSTNTFSATLGGFSGGQCFGCPYSSPVGVNSGNLSIVFTSPETGTMTFPGGSTEIQHFLYGYANKTDYFLGEWSFSLNVSGLISTQWVVFNGHYTGSDGTVYASGQEDNISGTVALGAYYPSGNFFIVGVEDNTGFSFQYAFNLADDRRMLGLGTIYNTGTSPPQPTDPSSGSRLLFPADLSTAAFNKSLKTIDSTKSKSRAERLAQYMQHLARQIGSHHPASQLFGRRASALSNPDPLRATQSVESW